MQQLERRDNLPLNPHIVKDGKYGVNLYRANFLPRLTQPRQRFAICPVQAIVLKLTSLSGQIWSMRCPNGWMISRK